MWNHNFSDRDRQQDNHGITRSSQPLAAPAASSSFGVLQTELEFPPQPPIRTDNENQNARMDDNSATSLFREPESIGYGLGERDYETGDLKSKDIFMKAKHVSILNVDSFYQFLAQKDLSLVMFYNSSRVNNVGDDDFDKKQFIQASNITCRPNHAYVAVDCGKEEMLCRREGIKQFPILNLYSRDQQVDSIYKKSDMTPGKLKSFVEGWPSYPNKSCCTP